MVRFKEGDTLGLINILALLLHKISITKNMFQKCTNITLKTTDFPYPLLGMVGGPRRQGFTPGSHIILDSHYALDFRFLICRIKQDQVTSLASFSSINL